MPGRSTNEPANYLAFGFQANQTTEATTFTFLRHLDGSGADIDEQIESVREGGDGQEVGLRYKTAITFDGSMVANDRPEVGARLWAAALGDDSPTLAALPGAASAASGVVNNHLASSDSTLPYLTVEQYWADVPEVGIGAQITSLACEFEQGRPFKLSADFMTGGSSYRRAVASIRTPTRETGQPFMYPNASLVISGAAASGLSTKVTKGKITVTRNLDGDIRTTGLNREDVVGQTMDTQVELTAKYESASTWYDPIHYALGGTQIPFDLATGAVMISNKFSSGTTVREMTVGINQLHWTQARVNKLDPEGKTMYIDLVGMGYKGATYQIYAQHTIASIGVLF
jgi:hypothetical protein